jgi:hypothetical protein
MQAYLLKPLFHFEEVKAINKKTSCVLITKTGDFTCWMYVKDFQFESLMQEHFNDNYLESRYPRAIFKGESKNLI